MTPNAELLTRIHDDAGSLGAVHYVQEDSLTFPVGVILDFEALTATILAEPNYDEILVSLTPYEPKAAEKVVALDAENPWLEMHGLPVLWAWVMTNQHGYTDGLRLQFGDPNDKNKSRTIEMVVAASSIQMLVVSPTSPPQANTPQPQSGSPPCGAGRGSMVN